eukprot:CAMPEP_0174231318 /NCGR_PEP_ID=MMETSP0417-20130205/1872_1 /TAXON_ID=242541 /ORGANISM="Mayorella sp, Strain BSH-02190019" /LENGTH=71 /DNA_ID=CAMNT_0015309177 /DNA_START=1 /DNA_END=217 /DNA_ORIENTATION=-
MKQRTELYGRGRTVSTERDLTGGTGGYTAETTPPLCCSLVVDWWCRAEKTHAAVDPDEEDEDDNDRELTSE